MADQKHLGLILDSKLTFTKHINSKIVTAKKNLGIIKHLSKYLPINILSQMYKIFVRSHLDYCDFIYHCPPLIQYSPQGVSLNGLMESIEQIQYDAALAVTGAWHGSNRSKLYEELGWETLSDRRLFRRATQLYKITNNMTPSYLVNKLPPRKRCSLYNADHSLSFRELRCRSSRYANSFFPNAINSWNNLICNFTNMPSILEFKSLISSLIRPNHKSTFKIHDPLCIRFLFMLRLNLSPLRSHKWHHNFIDTPSETCTCHHEAEDTTHFLLKCPLYTTSRLSLFATALNLRLKYNLPDLQKNLRVFFVWRPLNDRG